MKEENRHPLHILLCAGHKPQRHGDDDNMCKKIPKAAFPKILLHEVTKSVVIIFYIIYVAVSVQKQKQGYTLTVESFPFEYQVY